MSASTNSFYNQNYFTRMANSIGHKIEPDVRYHLAKVYTCLAATTACAAVGSLLHLMSIWEAGILSLVGQIALLITLMVTAPNHQKLFNIRLASLLGFGLLVGNAMGPLLDHVIVIQPQIIVNALVGTTVVFVSFTLAALLAERGKFLFLGGILMSVISTVSLVSLVNLFVRSQAVVQAHLYIILFVMSAFILYDTQAIMEKRRAGNTDCIQHSLDLFFDLASIFKRLLIILTQKEEREQRRRKN